MAGKGPPAQKQEQNARPGFIPLPPRMPGTMTPGGGSRGGSPLHSPRIPFATGSGTPAMSPLDAFAAQSRLLARQLEDESKRVGRRVSRLPHDTVAEHLAQRQRHLSPQMRQDGIPEIEPMPMEDDAGGEKPEIETVPPEFRPKSFYPRFSAVTAASETSSLPPMSPRQEEFSTPMEQSQSNQNDYFPPAPRAASPEPRPSQDQHVASRPSLESTSQSSYARSQSSFDSNHRHTDLHRGASIESSQSSKSMYASQHGALLPPNPPYARKSPSIRSVDSDGESTTGPVMDSELRRKASSGSGVSGPISPTSPTFRQPRLRRTPSQGSEVSVGHAHRLSKPAFNFSRPMSRQDRIPSRMSSIDSHTHPRHIDTALQTPTSVHEPLTPASFNDAQSVYGSIYGGDDQPRQSEELGRTYTHATYSLPRGRMVSRNSVPLEEMMPTFSWEDKQAMVAAGKLHPDHANTWPKQSDEAFVRQPPQDPRPTMPGSFDAVRPSMDSIRSVPAPAPPPQSTRNHTMNRHSMTSMSAASMNSGSTIKASSHKKQRSVGDEMTPDDHLAEGIACHESGSLNKSTYHLRLAANGGNSTAMMLYALACRHGWGMRQSPSEGVIWLRKAVDCASVEMADEGDNSTLTVEERKAKKARKAQFALSCYELGVSAMNGWGMEQDKALALRCYEIAASWGDADAMSETGYCYANGVGCKKNLKIAAKFYRQAEKMGVSMVGQSWIHKSKYDEDPAESDSRGRGDKKGGDSENKKRDKSRTRSIFGRKRT